MNEFIVRAMLAPVAGTLTEAQFLDALAPLWDGTPGRGLGVMRTTPAYASWFMRKWGKMNRGLVRDHYRRAELAREAQHR